MKIIFGITAQEHIRDTFHLMKKSLDILPHEYYSKVESEECQMGILSKTPAPSQGWENILMVSHSRLDYKEDLCKKLDTKPDTEEGVLIRMAYQKWGEDAVHHLEGDWAFVLFDSNKKRIFMARDKSGYGSLFFWTTKDSFRFSSSPIGLSNLPDFQRKINSQVFISKLLLLRKGDKDDYIFEQIKTLPPGHSLSWINGILEMNRYWFPEHIEEFRTRNNYSEELLELFREAVRQKLKNIKKGAILLSGGLDSGSVAVLSENISLDAFCHVPLYSMKDQGKRLNNERSQIQLTAKKAGINEIHWIQSADISPVQGLKRYIQEIHTITHSTSNYFWMTDIYNQAKTNGYSHLLSGLLGNGTISYKGVSTLPPYANEPLKNWTKKQILNFFPQLLEYRNQKFKSYISNQYLNSEVLNQHKEYIYSSLKSYYPFFKKASEAKLHLLQPGKNERLTLGGVKSLTYGIDLLDPTADIRVLEYCLKLPNHLYFNDKGEGRQVIKNTMKGILPDQVLFSNKKGIQASDIYFRLLHSAHEVEELLDEVSLSHNSQMWMNIPKLHFHWQWIKEGKRSDYLFVTNFFKGLGFAYFASTT